MDWPLIICILLIFMLIRTLQVQGHKALARNQRKDVVHMAGSQPQEVQETGMTKINEPAGISSMKNSMERLHGMMKINKPAGISSTKNSTERLQDSNESRSSSSDESASSDDETTTSKSLENKSSVEKRQLQEKLNMSCEEKDSNLIDAKKRADLRKEEKCGKCKFLRNA